MSPHVMIGAFLLSAFAKFAIALEHKEQLSEKADHLLTVGQGIDDDIKEDLTEKQIRSIHKHLDANHDGILSMSEAMKHASMDDLDLEGLDTNQDGSVNLQEYLGEVMEPGSGSDEEALKEQSALKSSETKNFKAADKNGDGVLNRDELQSMISPEEGLLLSADGSIEHFDLDGDGKLNLMEFREVLNEYDMGDDDMEDDDDEPAALLDEHPSSDDFENDELETDPNSDDPETESETDSDDIETTKTNKTDTQGEGERSNGTSLLSKARVVSKGDDMASSDEAQADFARLDVNHDGLLDSSEFQRWESGQLDLEADMQHMFKVADKDSDDQLTLDEMLAARKQISASDARFTLEALADRQES